MTLHCNARDLKGWSDFRKMILNQDTPALPSVTRIRQKYQQDGEYIGSKDRRKQRLSMVDSVAEWAVEED